MIMIRTVVLIVQLVIRMDSGLINIDKININQQPPSVAGSVLFSEMKIHPKDCIRQ